MRAHVKDSSAAKNKLPGQNSIKLSPQGLRMKLAQKLDTVAATVPRGKSDPSFQMRKQQHNSVSRGVDSGVGGGEGGC